MKDYHKHDFILGVLHTAIGKKYELLQDTFIKSRSTELHYRLTREPPYYRGRHKSTVRGTCVQVLRFAKHFGRYNPDQVGNTYDYHVLNANDHDILGKLNCAPPVNAFTDATNTQNGPSADCANMTFDGHPVCQCALGWLALSNPSKSIPASLWRQVIMEIVSHKCHLKMHHSSSVKFSKFSLLYA